MARVRPMRLGMLGTGRVNSRILTAAASVDEIEVVAVAGRDRQRVTEYAEHNGLSRAFATYEAMLSDDEIDAIYVGLPNALHLEWSASALEGGKHVLCEKPLSADPSGVDRLFDIADRVDKVLLEGFMYRYHPQTTAVQRLLAEGMIGALQFMRGVSTFPLERSNNVRWKASLGGGALMDVGCYCVNFARLLAGEPAWAAGSAVMTGDHDGVDEFFNGTLGFAAATAVFTVGFSLPRQQEFEIVGECGSIRIPSPFHCRESFLELHREGAVERVDVPAVNPFECELRNFVALATGGSNENVASRADSVGQARALRALSRSGARHEGTVVID